MVSFPYYSHTTPIRIPKDMGMVWEAYHKGVPLLGVPENPIDRKSYGIQNKVKLPRHLLNLISLYPSVCCIDGFNMSVHTDHY